MNFDNCTLPSESRYRTFLSSQKDPACPFPPTHCNHYCAFFDSLYSFVSGGGFFFFCPPPFFFFCLTEMYCLRVLEARVWNPGTLRVGSFWGLWGIVRENQFHASLPGSGALRCSLAGRWHPPYSSTSFAQHVSEFFHGLVCISSPFLFYCWVAFYCLDSP